MARTRALSTASRDGIVIEDQWRKKGHQRGKRWLYRVRDPYARRYRNAAFNTLGGMARR